MAKLRQQKLRSIVVRLSKKVAPDDILHELSTLYGEFSVAGENEAEVDFWLKCSRACGNLSSGMEKWFDEMKDELEEDEE